MFLIINTPLYSATLVIVLHVYQRCGTHAPALGESLVIIYLRLQLQTTSQNNNQIREDSSKNREACKERREQEVETKEEHVRKLKRKAKNNLMRRQMLAVVESEDFLLNEKMRERERRPSTLPLPDKVKNAKRHYRSATLSLEASHDVDVSDEIAAAMVRREKDKQTSAKLVKADRRRKMRSAPPPPPPPPQMLKTDDKQLVDAFYESIAVTVEQQQQQQQEDRPLSRDISSNNNTNLYSIETNLNNKLSVVNNSNRERSYSPLGVGGPQPTEDLSSNTTILNSSSESPLDVVLSYNRSASSAAAANDFDTAAKYLKFANLATLDGDKQQHLGRTGLVFESREQRLRLRATTLNNVGCLYKRLRNYEKALEYLVCEAVLY